MPEPMVVITILGMALVTALTRVAGYWVMSKVRIRGRLAAALDAVPGAILTAIVVPAAFSAGPAEAVAALFTVALAWRFPMIVAITGGVGCVVLLRHVLG